MWRVRVILCVYLAVAPAQAGIFDFTEFDDPFSTLAQVNRNGLFRNTLGAECTTVAINGASARHGVCKSALDCKLSGGQLGGRGSCSLQQCCVFEGLCESVSSKKVSYFKSPRTLPESNLCTFTVKAATNNVCQMRIDFEEFRLAQPSIVDGTDAGYACMNDAFHISTSNEMKVPIICGFNDGQHMYIPVNVSNNEPSIKLRVHLADRSSSNRPLDTPQWRIRVTQLECPTYGTKASVLAATRDFSVLAPAGCLQYFTARSGNVSNFGYNPGLKIEMNHYIANHNYGICFRRSPFECSMRFSPGAFRLSNPDNEECKDYLFIPEATITGAVTNTVSNYKFCGNALETEDSATAVPVVQSVVPTPLYMHFVTDDKIVQTMDEERGFLLFWAIQQASAGSCP